MDLRSGPSGMISQYGRMMRIQPKVIRLFQIRVLLAEIFYRNALPRCFLLMALDSDFNSFSFCPDTSPIILNDNGVHWKAQVGVLWEFFETFSKVQTNDTCGTHVHISPKEETTWSLGHLKRLSMAIIWFEPAVEVILPKQRRQNIWAKANHKDHPQFKAQTVENILHMINSCERIHALIECMNPQDIQWSAGLGLCRLLHKACPAHG